MSRIVVVSHRAPSTDPHKDAGGLVVAVREALEKTGGLWIGSRQSFSERPSEEFQRISAGNYDILTYALTKEDSDNFYLGYANSVLWPLFHGRIDLLDYRTEFRAAYRSVNRQLAKMMARIIEPGDLIWIHDYHFLPLAMELRRAGVSNAIGLFLHIPVPPMPTFLALTGYRNVARWFADFDLIGLQTKRDVAAMLDIFRDSLRGELLENGDVKVERRRVRVASFPIGIDVEAFHREAMAGPEERRGDQQIQIIGVDRLDYSKGLPQRIRAFGRYLRRNPNMRRRISFLQISPPTRDDLTAYQDIRTELEMLTGRINGEFADIDWTPIRYVHRQIPRPVLARLYRQSKIALVTPLADGMNLVAKEYVAAQDEDDPGVLILSRFAGAAEQLTAALQINPHDIDEFAAAIEEAVKMSLSQRKRRQREMFEIISRQDIHWWSSRYLSELQKLSDGLQRQLRPAQTS